MATLNDANTNNRWFYLSAYAIAVKHGYGGSEAQFVEDLMNGAAYAKAAAEEARDEAQRQAGLASGSATEAQAQAATAAARVLDAEAFGTGTRAGEPVAEGDAAYENNARYYSDLAADSATASATSAQTARDYSDHIGDPVAGIVTGWLDEHVDPETGYVIDDSLTIEGAAADAKAAGDAIAPLYDRDEVDLSRYPVSRWRINPENHWQFVTADDNLTTSTMIRLRRDETVITVTGGANTGVIALLETAVKTAGETPDWAEGYTGRISVDVGETVTLTPGPDAAYLYVLLTASEGQDTTPTVELLHTGKGGTVMGRDALTAADDADDVREAGVYPCDDGADLPDNLPAAIAGTLLVYGRDHVAQEYVTDTGAWRRMWIAGNWSAWLRNLEESRTVREEINIAQELTFEQGAIRSSNGQDYSSSAPNYTTRIRSVGYWAAPQAECMISLRDEGKKLFVLRYDAALNYISAGASGWVSAGVSVVVHPGEHLRFVVAFDDDGEITPETGAVTDLVLLPVEDIDNLPTLYLSGDIEEMSKEKKVNLDYRFMGRTGTLTCKWQGSSSTRYPKKNYTLKFDNAFDAWGLWLDYLDVWKTTHQINTHSESDTRYTWTRQDGKIKRTSTTTYSWGSRKKYVAKANWVDPSMARNIVGARLWAQVVATRENPMEQLTLCPNAVDGFPIRIVMNGEDMGLYTFNTPKDENLFGMGEGAAEYIVGGEKNTKAGSWMRTVVDSDLYDIDRTVLYAIEFPDDVYDDDGYPAEEMQETFDAIRDSLNAAISASLDAHADWETDCASYIDVDSVIDYYIFACCIGGHDNMAKNILYGSYDGVKWFLSAYDMDTTFGVNPYGSRWFDVVNDRNQFAEAAEYDRETGTYVTANSRTKHRLFHLVHRYSREKLVARYRELRATVLSDENVWFELVNFIQDIPQTLYDENRRIWTTMLGTSTADMHQYMDFYRMHCAYLDEEIAELEATLPAETP